MGTSIDVRPPRGVPAPAARPWWRPTRWWRGGSPRRRGRRRSATRRVLAGAWAEALAYALLAGGIALPVLLTSPGRLPVDTSAHLYLDPARALGNALEMWSPSPSLGQPNYNTGIAPLAATFWLVRLLVTDVELAMRLWRLALLLVAAAGAARLFHHLRGSGAREVGGAHWSDRVGRVTAAAVYVCNPYMVVAGATSPILVPAAVLPWLLLALHRGVEDALRRRSDRRGSGKGVATLSVWRWPAAFGVAVFAMTGVNAGVVPAFMLLSVPCYLVWARLTGRAPSWVLLAVTARCALTALAVSAYWLTPAVLASSVAVNVANFTEGVETIAEPSSYAETLRGLGFWVMYGRTGAEPWQPGFAGYLTSPLVVVASFALPLAAALGAFLSRARLRLLGALLLGLAVPLMVGLYPPRSPSPLGKALDWAFTHLPGAIALRTTNKAGALAMLGWALLIALGATEVARRLRRPTRRALALAAAAAVLAVAVLPAWTGGLYPVAVAVPDYWREAASDLNASAPGSRVLLLPDQQNASYRWGSLSTEDVSQTLLSRNTAIRSSVGLGASVEQANFLAAMAAPLEPGWSPGGLASMARYAGVADILVRHDLRWEDVSDRHPSEVDARVRQEPGLTLAGTYGRQGENTLRPASLRALAGDNADGYDALLTPLVRYLVNEPKAVLRTEAARDTLLMDGDSFALPTMARFGLLQGEPPFRLLGSLGPAEFERALLDGDAGRIVLSDSNRRRTWTTSRLVQSYSPTMRADDPIGADEASLTLFGTEQQSVTALTGAKRISASRVGSVFGVQVGERALFAFDGDPATAWTTGDFGTAVGQSVTIDLGREVEFDAVTLRPAATLPTRIASARVEAGDRVVDVDFADDPGSPPVRVALGKGRTDRLTVTITGVRGTAGDNPVGFAEIAIPGVKVTETVRLPRALLGLARDLSPAARAALARTPLDVALKRQGLPRGSFRDEERVVDRTFWLPDRRTFRFAGTISPGPGLPDPVIDALAGQVGLAPGNAPGDEQDDARGDGQSDASGEARSDEQGGQSLDRSSNQAPSAAVAGAARPRVVANSSSRWRGEVGSRASRALDGDFSTGWSPATRNQGEWMEVTFPPQRLNRIVIHQPPVLPGNAIATRALLSLDGGAPIPVRLGAGATRVNFPAQRVGSARLTITGVSGFGDQVRITELGIGKVRSPRSPVWQRLRGCVTVATIDGRPLRATLRGTVGDLDQLGSLALGPCSGSGNGAALRLGAGEHRLRAAKGWLLDELHLRSEPRRASPSQASRVEPAPPPGGRVLRSTRTTASLTTRKADEPYYLVLGQGFDRNWSATMDGQPLGPPILLDGYSAAWRIDDLDPHRFEITYSPQRPTAVAQAFSLVSLVVLAVVWLRPRRGRERGAASPARAVAMEAPARGSPGTGTPAAVSVGTLARGQPAAGPPANGPPPTGPPTGIRTGAPEVPRSDRAGFGRRAAGAVLRVAGWVATCALLWFAGGVPGLLLGAVLVAWDAARSPSPRQILGAAAVLLGLVPVAVLLGGLPTPSTISALWVADDRGANALAFAGLALLVIGVLRDDHRARHPGR